MGARGLMEVRAGGGGQTRQGCQKWQTCDRMHSIEGPLMMNDACRT
eukprot:COSAG06_NODE_70809_length_190_cov_19.340659_1_plen_45_part_10